MRNFFKRSERNSRSRRPNRGVSAVAASLASAALVAGLASYPVGAQDTAVVSTTDSAVQTTRTGSVDTITIDDFDGATWGYGAKASIEDIFAIKRSGAGEIEEILSLTVDGTTLDPEFYGFTNNAMGGFIAFDLDALNEVPPKLVELEVRTSAAADYSIAESDEVPTARELSASGYGKNANAAASTNPTGVGMARATGETKWSEEVALSSEIIGTGEQRFPNVGTEPYFEVRPTGNHPKQVGEDIRITRIVVHNTENNSRKADNEADILKNDGADGQVYFKEPVQVKDGKNRVKGFEAVFFDPATGKSPVASEFLIRSGQDSLKIGVDGVDGWDKNLDTLRQRYIVEVYGSFRVPVDPSTSPSSETPRPTTTTTPGSSSGAPTTTVATPTNKPAGPTTPLPGPNPSENKKFAIEGAGGMWLGKTSTSGTNPYSTSAKVQGQSTFDKAVVRISAPNSILALEHYRLEVDQIEEGVTFGLTPKRISKDFVEFEVYPTKNGQRIASATLPDGATFTLKSEFGDSPSRIDAVVSIYGTGPVTKPKQELVTPPDGADYIEKQYPNPEMPKKCGLKIAIVADHSRSLKYADVNGFGKTREAVGSMLEALKNAPHTYVGLYTFNTYAPSDKRQAGTTGGAVPVNVNGQINPTLTNVLEDWKTERTASATNWEAGLKQVQGQGYDVVYFITDGMPTYDDLGWQTKDGTKDGEPLDHAGAFVQEKSLNQAILAANQLKREGTRVVPIMVDLTMRAGNVITRDYVLKNIHAYHSGANKANSPGFVTFDLRHLQRNPTYEGKDYYENWKRAVYRAPGDSEPRDVVNVEQGILSEATTKDGSHFMDIVQNGKYSTILTSDKDKWTYGLRDVKQMGEDISGPGDTIRVEQYSKLANQLKSISDELQRLCEGRIIVKKQIVNAKGNVEIDGANGWEFVAIADDPILNNGGRAPLRADAKTTANDPITGAGTLSWKLATDSSSTVTIDEVQQDGFSLYQRGDKNDKNAVCTQQFGNSEPTELEVVNVGKTSFRVPVNVQGSQVATVTCVVANSPKDAPEPVKFGIELAKVDFQNRETTLDGAEFIVQPVSGANEDSRKLVPGTGSYSIGKELDPEVVYQLIETKSPSRGGVAYSLLTAPVTFKGVAGKDGIQIEYLSGERWVRELPDRGLWSTSPHPDKRDKGLGYLQVANIRQGDLPKTGGLGLQVPAVVGALIVALGAGLLRRRAA